MKVFYVLMTLVLLSLALSEGPLFPWLNLIASGGFLLIGLLVIIQLNSKNKEKTS